MEYRTDLAVEYTREAEQEREETGPFAVTRLTHAGSRYVTVESPPFSDTVDTGELAARAGQKKGRELKSSLPMEHPADY